MNLKHLFLILLWLDQIPVPSQHEALDVESWLMVLQWKTWNDLSRSEKSTAVSHAHARFFHIIIFPASQVEVCAGAGRLSEAMRDCGLATKAFDVAGLNWSLKNLN